MTKKSTTPKKVAETKIVIREPKGTNFANNRLVPNFLVTGNKATPYEDMSIKVPANARGSKKSRKIT